MPPKNSRNSSANARAKVPLAMPQDSSATATALSVAGAVTNPAGESAPAWSNTSESGGDAAGSASSDREIPQGDDKAAALVKEPDPEVSADELSAALEFSGCDSFTRMVAMAKTGRSLVWSIEWRQELDGPLKGWAPEEDPSEVVGELYDRVIVLQAELAIAKADVSESGHRRLHITDDELAAMSVGSDMAHGRDTSALAIVGGKAIRITSKREGFRRAGMVHTVAPRDYQPDEISPEQLEIFLADPVLSVEIV